MTIAPATFPHRNRLGWKLALLTLGVTLLFVLSFRVGHYPITIGQITAILLSTVIDVPRDWPATMEVVVLSVRLPRIAAALLVGAALAVAGAAYQTMFRNPLVSPAILGVSAGAGFGASLALILQLPAAAIQAAAFGFGLMAVAIAVFIARRLAGNSTIILILAGMVVAAVFQALISGLKYVADPTDALPAITFWLLGSLTRVTGDQVLTTLLPSVAAFLVLYAFRWPINVSAMGEDEARSLGVDLPRLRIVLIVAATLLTAAAVSIAGIVGWVGLLVPHMARMVAGPNFQALLPTSALMGAGFLLLVDDACRGATASEVPLGILTALIGAPVFLALLAKVRQGWF
jgi:iron complex transport system permease protein